jgi:hypothetical protein
MGTLGKLHIGPRVPGTGLPQPRVARMRENLIDTVA